MDPLEILRWTLNDANMAVLAQLTVGPSSVSRLADATGFSRQSVWRTLRKLRELGIVGKARTNARFGADVYELAVARLEIQSPRNGDHPRIRFEVTLR